VSDDGPGLDADDWDRAADRFWRGQTDVRGSGLGLSIAREIVEGQQGSFVLRRGPGGGAEVCFGLPLAGGGDR
jgi:signal transduction histidine kinase